MRLNPFQPKEFGPDNPRAWSAAHPSLDGQRKAFVVGEDDAPHETHGVLRAHRATKLFGKRLMDLLLMSPERLQSQLSRGLDQEGIAGYRGVPIVGSALTDNTMVLRAKHVQQNDELVAHKAKVNSIKWVGGDPNFYLSNGMVVRYLPLDEVIVRRG